jgi:hypothetical protein
MNDEINAHDGFATPELDAAGGGGDGESPPLTRRSGSSPVLREAAIEAQRSAKAWISTSPPDTEDMEDTPAAEAQHSMVVAQEEQRPHWSLRLLGIVRDVIRVAIDVNRHPRLPR